MGILKIFSGTSSLVREQRIRLVRQLGDWETKLGQVEFGKLSATDRNTKFMDFWQSAPSLNALFQLAKKYREETNLYGTQHTSNENSKNALSPVEKTR